MISQWGVTDGLSLGFQQFPFAQPIVNPQILAFGGRTLLNIAGELETYTTRKRISHPFCLKDPPLALPSAGTSP